MPDRNPAATVNIRIVRDGKNEIFGAAYMTEKEMEALVEASIVSDHNKCGRGNIASPGGNDRLIFTASARTERG